MSTMLRIFTLFGFLFVTVSFSSISFADGLADIFNESEFTATAADGTGISTSGNIDGSTDVTLTDSGGSETSTVGGGSGSTAARQPDADGMYQGDAVGTGRLFGLGSEDWVYKADDIGALADDDFANGRFGGGSGIPEDPNSRDTSAARQQIDGAGPEVQDANFNDRESKPLDD